MASEIESMYYRKLTVGAAYRFFSDISALIEGKEEVLHLETIAPVFSTNVKTLGSLVNRATAFESTIYLAESDEDRDSTVGVVNQVIRAHHKSPIPKKKKASRHLSSDLAPYMDISRHEYAKESAEIHGMLEVLKKEENVEAIATLGLTEEVAHLEEAQAAFDALWEARFNEVEKRAPQTRLKTEDVLEKIYPVYQELVRTINAYAIVSPTPEITGFIDKANARISVYNRIAESGGSGPGSGEDDRPVIPDEPEEKPTDPEESDESDRPVIPEEPEEGEETGETGKDENGDDLPPIE